jgi:hypothetical protein
MTKRPDAPYAGYDVLSKRDTPSWNEQTRGVVARRLHEVPERRFFTRSEWELLEAVVERLLPQEDRGDRPVPIVPWIDRGLEEEVGDGYRFVDMPPAGEAWRLGLAGIEEESLARHGRSFTRLAASLRDEVLRAVQEGAVASPAWERLPPRRFFTMVLKSVVAIYYSHPWAWSEIGFGGPASPRGYVRLGFDQRDPWEAEEHP